MVFIYCIEDINDLKYVGSTKQTINIRHTEHKCQKYNKTRCSSKKLILENSIIYVLEECSEEDRKERERYWINKLDTVNINKLNYTDEEWCKNNRDKKNASCRKNYHKYGRIRKPLTQEQRDRRNARRREEYKLKREHLEK
mgnify:CR=1 FL=1